MNRMQKLPPIGGTLRFINIPIQGVPVLLQVFCANVSAVCIPTSTPTPLVSDHAERFQMLPGDLSMGGHGALTIAMKNPSSWVSVSAFAPICNPTKCPWGEAAFYSYLGSVAAGEEYDAAALMEARGPFPGYDDILVDQGLKDGFLTEGQLRPEALEAAARKVGQKLTVRRHVDHGHSYYFIASFVDDHVEFHAERLRKKMASTGTPAKAATPEDDSAPSS